MLTLKFWLALTGTALFLLAVFHLADWAVQMWRRRRVVDMPRRGSSAPMAQMLNTDGPHRMRAGTATTDRGTTAGHVLRMEDKLRRLELEATLHFGRKRVH